MKFFFGILLVALVALASAEEAKKELNPEHAVAVNEAEPATSGRDRRGILVGGYASPVVAAPVAAAPVAVASPVAAPIAVASPVGAPFARVAAPFAAAPVAVAGPVPVAYSYSSSVPYPYAGYGAYAAPAVYL